MLSDMTASPISEGDVLDTPPKVPRVREEGSVMLGPLALELRERSIGSMLDVGADSLDHVILTASQR